MLKSSNSNRPALYSCNKQRTSVVRYSVRLRMTIIIVIAQPASQSSPRFRSIQCLCTFQSVFRTSDLSLQVSEFSDHACRKQIYCMVRAELSQNSVSRVRLSQRIYLLKGELRWEGHSASDQIRSTTEAPTQTARMI